MGEVRHECNILVAELERKRPLGRHRNKWEDNIKMGMEIGRWDVDRIRLGCCKQGNEPLDFIKGRDFFFYRLAGCNLLEDCAAWSD
jgi:hypothetical protein